ncbi:hypothetical protein CN354_12610 [Bacillus cereus]|nr:hypothetical protein CN354_12610 [Bacillus cereus]
MFVYDMNNLYYHYFDILEGMLCIPFLINKKIDIINKKKKYLEKLRNLVQKFHQVAEEAGKNLLDGAKKSEE